MTARQLVSIKAKSDEPSPVQNGAAVYDEVYAENGQYVSEEIYWDKYYENSDLSAEQADQRAERYAAILKSMGVAVDEIDNSP